MLCIYVLCGLCMPVINL